MSRLKRRLDRLQICGSGLAAARIVLHVECQLLAFIEVAHAGTLDRRNVNEHIRAAIVLHDEAESLLGVEEFNGTCGHQGLLNKTRKRVVPHTNHSPGSHPGFCVSWERTVRPK